MTDGRTWNVEVHDPSIGRGSLLSEHRDLLVDEAITLMENNSDKALCLRQRGEALPSDHRALHAFQVRTGKRLLPMFG
jgi:hypothetical protein